MKNVREIVHRRLKLLFIILLVTALVAMIAGCGKDTASDSNSEIDNIKEEDMLSEDDKDVDSDSNNIKEDEQTDNISEADDKISEGEYIVGIDMPAGEYLLYKYEEEDQSTAPFISVDNAEGDYISHLNFKNFVYYTVSQGQEVYLIDAYAIPADKVLPYEPIDNKYIEGMYKVGFDIPAGDYKIILETDKRVYVAVYSDSKNVPDSIITEVYIEGDVDISVKKGEYLRFTGAYIIAD